MATFTNIFDHTFAGTANVVPVNVNLPQDCGVTLMYLTLQGWLFWTFEANTETRTSVKKQSTFVTNKLQRSIQKSTAKSYILRTGNLTETESYLVGGVVSATSVYWLRTTDLGVTPLPVFVETTDVTLWQQLQSRGGMEIQITFPFVNSLRR